MIAPQTTLDVEREDEVSAVPDVARVDAAFASVEAELTAARAALRADARVAARSLIAGETPTSDVRDAIARVGELEAVLVGLGEVRIVAQYPSDGRARCSRERAGWNPETSRDAARRSVTASRPASKDQARARKSLCRRRHRLMRCLFLSSRRPRGLQVAAKPSRGLMNSHATVPFFK